MWHFWSDFVQHLWFITEGWTWPAQLACSCVRVAAIRCCCVPTATTVSFIAAGRARRRLVKNIGTRPPGAASAVEEVGSSMLREQPAGAHANVFCARPTQVATSIK